MDTAKVMIPDIKFQVIYLNPDDSEIMNFVITQDDISSTRGHGNINNHQKLENKLIFGCCCFVNIIKTS
jgi:hypothetical protein